jgi:hypothetical protein
MITVDMTWPKYVLVVIYALALLGTISQIGKPREPLSPGSASFSVVFTGLMVALVLVA